MRIGLLASGGLGFDCVKHLFDVGCDFECILTDSNSSAIIELAESTGVPLFKGNPRKGKASSFINAHEIDVLISVNYLFLVDEDILNWPSKIAINFHGSLLPLYRGRTPHVWAIINGEVKSGVTCHILEKECDAGDVLLQKEVVVDKDTTGGDLLHVFASLYPKMLDEVIQKISINNLSMQKQDESKATYFGKRTPEDGEIDWDWTKDRIRNWVRAQAYPYPGAFTFFNQKKVIIDKVSVVEFDKFHELENGVLLQSQPEMIVKVSDGFLRIDQLRDKEKYSFEDLAKFTKQMI